MTSRNLKLLLLLLLLLPACARPARLVVQPFADAKHWMLVEPLKYRIGTTVHVIEVPKGFVTDFASVPPILSPVLPPTGRYLAAAIVHDFLYWDQTCDRRDADKLLAAAMKESQVDDTEGGVIHLGVRLGGWLAWRRNAAAKAGGELQVLPPRVQNIPLDMTWPQYAAKLRMQNTIDASYRRPDREACRAASLLH
ncbi:MAG TPA: DUF1353 domain-containing protein [Thermoanaerobaculia bacterium]|nr:DUF1353 domain-containing protein [Thermoanaerobaculia bacterium]